MLSLRLPLTTTTPRFRNCLVLRDAPVPRVERNKIIDALLVEEWEAAGGLEIQGDADRRIIVVVRILRLAIPDVLRHLAQVERIPGLVHIHLADERRNVHRALCRLDKEHLGRARLAAPVDLAFEVVRLPLAAGEEAGLLLVVDEDLLHEGQVGEPFLERTDEAPHADVTGLQQFQERFASVGIGRSAQLVIFLELVRNRELVFGRNRKLLTLEQELERSRDERLIDLVALGALLVEVVEPVPEGEVVDVGLSKRPVDASHRIAEFLENRDVEIGQVRSDPLLLGEAETRPFALLRTLEIERHELLLVHRGVPSPALKLMTSAFGSPAVTKGSEAPKRALVDGCGRGRARHRSRGGRPGAEPLGLRRAPSPTAEGPLALTD